MKRSVALVFLVSTLGGCGYSEQEWQAQLSKSERMQSENMNLRAQLADAQRELESARAQPAVPARAEREAPAPLASAPPVAVTPAPTVGPTVAPPAPTAVNREDGIKLDKLRGRIAAGAKPEPVVEVQVKALGADAKITLEQLEGPCTLELDKLRVRASATEAGTCKGRITALNAAGTQRTIKDFSLEATAKKAEKKP